MIETVFVVDDNPGVRRSLRALLESASLAVQTFASAEEFLAAYEPGHPGCLVLDVRLRQSNGLDLQDELRRRQVTLPVIVLTGHGTVPTSVRAMKAGAVDFLQKPAVPKLLVERIRAALAQDRAARAVSSEHSAVLDRVAELTPRERQVMELMLTGLVSKEMATALQVSVRTIEGHRRRVLAKLGVTSAAQLVRMVMRARGTESST